jgi:hypothetical protein
MVNREVDSTSPPIPAVLIASFWQRSPPTLPNQTPSVPPAGFRVFGQFPPRYSARIIQVSGRGSGLGSQAAEPFAIRSPRPDSARAAGALFLPRGLALSARSRPHSVAPSAHRFTGSVVVA